MPRKVSEMENEELLEANGIIEQLVTAIGSGNQLRIEAALERALEYRSRPTKRAADGSKAAQDEDEIQSGEG
jgi:hypothetical protein